MPDLTREQYSCAREETVIVYINDFINEVFFFLRWCAGSLLGRYLSNNCPRVQAQRCTSNCRIVADAPTHRPLYSSFISHRHCAYRKRDVQEKKKHCFDEVQLDAP